VKLVLASANPDKAAEIVELLPGHELLPRPAEVPDVVEDGETLLDNARLKAAALARATGLPAVADDTGLEVAALGGEPGVYTARWAGDSCTYADNVAKLLREMDGVADRRARWRTIAIVMWPDGREAWAEGTCDGVVAESARGAQGFGYDPAFVPDGGDGRTFAELTRGEKSALSHRGRAFRALAALLPD
jgi:XTP/dITP diphosphohydrolase